MKYLLLLLSSSAFAQGFGQGLGMLVPNYNPPSIFNGGTTLPSYEAPFRALDEVELSQIVCSIPRSSPSSVVIHKGYTVDDCKELLNDGIETALQKIRDNVEALRKLSTLKVKFEDKK